MQKYILFFFVLFICGCGLPSIDDVQIDGEYALPLINDRVTFESLLGRSEQFDVLMADDGSIVLRYSTELISDSIENLLPSIPSIGEVPIIDTLTFFPLTTSDNFVITRALLSGDEMRFRYSHDADEDLMINMQVPELSKDGKIFEFDFSLESPGIVPYTAFTQSFDLSGYEFKSDENQMTFQYDARRPDGERIKLSFAAMSFNELIFAYGEGSFERTAYALSGDSLEIDVFTGWQSGEVEFENPSISFDVTHSFGFPISINIEEVSLTTIENEVKLLAGTQVNQEVPLDFPQLDEVGSSSSTEIILDKNNSNIASLFNQRVKFVDYKVTAIINPSGDLDMKGFMTDESAFSIDASLNIPLTLKVNNLLLTDTIGIEKLLPDAFTSAEFKIITENTYPINMSLDFIFLDENNEEVERLFGSEPLIVEPSPEKTRFIDLDDTRISKLKQAKKIVVEPNFDTSQINDDFVQFFSDQYLEVRVGLKFKL